MLSPGALVPYEIFPAAVLTSPTVRRTVLGHRWHLAPSEKRHHSPHEQALSAGRYEFVRLQLLPERSTH